MINVLITGTKSYVGLSFERFATSFAPSLNIKKISLRDASWHQEDFSIYDVIFHVAGIAHSETGGADEFTKQMYYEINRDLAVEVAKKAKSAGVGQFIFMSSMIVFGNSGAVGVDKMITDESEPNPANFYGDSKWQAECALQQLSEEDFKVCIIRPPMIYGRNSKGNYPKLSKLARTLPVFPDIKNERSMIYVENLCKFIELMIKNQEMGVFHPQNEAYVRTSHLVKTIARVHKHPLMLTKTFNGAIKRAGKGIGLVNKVFGNFTYDLSMSDYKENYRLVNFKDSIEATEKKS